MHFKNSILFLIAIFCVIFIAHSFFNHLIAFETPDNSTLAQRIAPVGQVYLEGDIDVNAVKKPAPVSKSAKARSGKEVYTSTCSACHSIGVLGAPKFGNAADWAPRLKQGIDGLLKVAISGKGAMPPKGTCSTCSSVELKAAIEYMSK
jgi:cytochrome c5